MIYDTERFVAKDIGSFENLKEQFRGKYFLGKDLGLTGSEVSLSCLPAGKATSVHFQAGCGNDIIRAAIRETR